MSALRKDATKYLKERIDKTLIYVNNGENLGRALDKTKTNGYLNITHPLVLFGSIISNLSLSFENGRITSFDADISKGKLLSLYLEQDPQAGVASMLTIAEDTNPASLVDLTAYPEWDRMRGVSVTIGSPKCTAVEGELVDKANDSIVSLSLPIGSDSTTITLFDDDGNEYMIFEDGIILEEE
jgi:aminopeptidase